MFLNYKWIIGIVLAAMFCGFTWGMNAEKYNWLHNHPATENLNSHFTLGTWEDGWFEGFNSARRYLEPSSWNITDLSSNLTAAQSRIADLESRPIPTVTVTVTPPPVTVEVPTSTPITLTSFYSAQELDSYLASDNTNLLNFITNQADNGAIINWLYSSRLRLEAVAQGKYIVEENLNDTAYFTWYGQHLPQGVQYFQIDKTYVWGDKDMELWYIDPKTDKHWFVCYLWLNTEDSMIKPPII